MQTLSEAMATALRERPPAAEGSTETSAWQRDDAREPAIARLADALDIKGVIVEYVMAGNRNRAVFGKDGYEFPRHSGQGEVLLVRSPAMRARVFLRPSSAGWWTSTNRYGSSCGAGAGGVDITDLADALVSVLKELEEAEPPTAVLDPGNGSLAGESCPDADTRSGWGCP